MSHGAVLVDSPTVTPTTAGPRRTHALTGAVSTAALAGLGLMHFAVDGLSSVLVPLQPVIAARTGATPALLGLVVAVALSTGSLLQPLAARLVHRYGQRRVATVGAVLGAIGYGFVPVASSVVQAVVAVVVGGVGSSLFHPAAGALMARASGAGGDALSLAVFSAVGTAGAAIVPFGVLISVDSLGWAAAAPVAAVLVVLTVVLRAGVFRQAEPRSHQVVVVAGSGGRSVLVAVTAAAMIALAATTVAASSAVLVAADLGDSHPAVAWVVATFSASGAVGGLALAVWARRVGVRAVLMGAVMTGTLAAASLPIMPLPLMFVAVSVAGAGLAGSLPLLIAHARRPGESSAAGAIGRVLGLGAGLGGAGYAVVALAQGAVGYGTALTSTVLLAGAAALASGWFLCRNVDPAQCFDPVLSASSACAGGSCVCG